MSADLARAARQEAIHVELEDIATTYGTRYVGLFAADGRRIDSFGGGQKHIETSEARSVLSSGKPSVTSELHEGEVGQENRHMFLLPVRSPTGGDFVVIVDQRADIIGELLADLRLRKVFGLLLGLLLAVPLLYLLGGWS